MAGIVESTWQVTLLKPVVYLHHCGASNPKIWTIFVKTWYVYSFLIENLSFNSTVSLFAHFA
jgi:membrane associated rhomboid family serine protease